MAPLHGVITAIAPARSIRECFGPFRPAPLVPPLCLDCNTVCGPWDVGPYAAAVRFLTLRPTPRGRPVSASPSERPVTVSATLTGHLGAGLASAAWLGAN